jgi:carbon monoxide dehydrogenase subunit G
VKLEGAYTFDAPREVAWQALLDPEVLARVMPGGEALEKIGENEYKGQLKIRVGPVQGQFEGLVTLADINAPESYRMQVSGKGAPGFMKGEGQVRLEEQGNSTLMHYSGEAQVGGRIASVGQRLLDSSAKALIRQSLDGLHEQIRARVQARTNFRVNSSLTAAGGAEPLPAPEVKAPSQTDFALGVAKNLLDDLVPVEQRSKLMAGGLAALGGLFVFWLLSEWLVNRVANRVIDVLEQRR